MPGPFTTIKEVQDGDVLTVYAPSNQLAEVDAATLGECRDTKCHMGVKNQSYAEHRAIEEAGGGEIRGPWTIDDSNGLLIENTSDDPVVCSIMGRVI